MIKIKGVKPNFLFRSHETGCKVVLILLLRDSLSIKLYVVVPHKKNSLIWPVEGTKSMFSLGNK